MHVKHSTSSLSKNTPVFHISWLTDFDWCCFHLSRTLLTCSPAAKCFSCGKKTKPSSRHLNPRIILASFSGSILKHAGRLLSLDRHSTVFFLGAPQLVYFMLCWTLWHCCAPAAWACARWAIRSMFVARRAAARPHDCGLAATCGEITGNTALIIATCAFLVRGHRHSPSAHCVCVCECVFKLISFQFLVLIFYLHPGCCWNWDSDLVFWARGRCNTYTPVGVRESTTENSLKMNFKTPIWVWRFKFLHLKNQFSFSIYFSNRLLYMYPKLFTSYQPVRFLLGSRSNHHNHNMKIWLTHWVSYPVCRKKHKTKTQQSTLYIDIEAVGIAATTMASCAFFHSANWCWQMSWQNQSR